MYRPNKNLVMAKEQGLAHFRPANQMLLVPDHSANPQPGDPQSMLPGMGEVRQGNGFGSNGLVSGAADARMAKNILGMRMTQALVQQAGSPNGKSRPVMTMSLSRALADLPSAPQQGALEVDLSFAGNSLQSEQWLLKQGLGLRPIKAFGKKQTFVTTQFGNDADALKYALARQPDISVIDIRAYEPAAEITPVAPRLLWEHVDTLDIPGTNMRWIITRAPTSTSYRYCATLYRHRADSDDEIVRTDNLADEVTARAYIKSYEVQQGNFGGAGHPNKTLFWNGSMRQGGDAGLTNAAARASRTGFSVVNAPEPETTNGMGAMRWNTVAAQIARQQAAKQAAKKQPQTWGTVKRLPIAMPGVSQVANNLKYPPQYMLPRAPVAMEGLGAVTLESIPAWVIAAVALGAFAIMTKNRYAGT